MGSSHGKALLLDLVIQGYGIGEQTVGKTLVLDIDYQEGWLWREDHRQIFLFETWAK